MRLPAPTIGSPGLLPILYIRLEAACDPGWIQLTCLYASCIVACWHLKTISPFQSGHFGTQNLHSRLLPLPLLLACFRTYASSNLLPSYLQGSIPGLWLAVTGAGFAPARICSIAQPKPRLDPNLRNLRVPLQSTELKHSKGGQALLPTFKYRNCFLFQVGAKVLHYHLR